METTDQIVTMMKLECRLREVVNWIPSILPKDWAHGMPEFGEISGSLYFFAPLGVIFTVVPVTATAARLRFTAPGVSATRDDDGDTVGLSAGFGTIEAMVLRAVALIQTLQFLRELRDDGFLVIIVRGGHVVSYVTALNEPLSNFESFDTFIVGLDGIQFELRRDGLKSSMCFFLRMVGDDDRYDKQFHIVGGPGAPLESFKGVVARYIQPKLEDMRLMLEKCIASPVSAQCSRGRVLE